MRPPRPRGLFGDTGQEGLNRRPALHHAALMRSLMVVVMQVAVEVALHLLDRLVPRGAPGHRDLFIEQGAVQSFDEAVALRAPHRVVRCSMPSNCRNSSNGW